MQGVVVVQNPRTDALLDAAIDHGQVVSDHLESTVLGLTETAYNVGSDIVEDALEGVGRMLTDGVTGLGRSLLGAAR